MVSIHLSDATLHEDLTNLLARFSCETMDLRQEPEPTLFDDVDEVKE